VGKTKGQKGVERVRKRSEGRKEGRKAQIEDEEGR
jgi:hypothetical protein